MIIGCSIVYVWHYSHLNESVASFTKEVNLRSAKRPLKTNGRLANLGLKSLVGEAIV